MQMFDDGMENGSGLWAELAPLRQTLQFSILFMMVHINSPFHWQRTKEH